MGQIRRLLVPILTLLPLLAALPARADLVGHGGMVRAVDVSADGSMVLTGSFDFTARLWDFGSQTERAVLDAHAGPVTNVAFLPDNRRGVTTSDDGTAIVWDLETAEPIHVLEGHGHKVMAVSVSPDGKQLVTGGWDSTVRLWSLADGSQQQVIETGSPVNAVAFLAGGSRVAAGLHDSNIRIYDTAKGEIQGTLEAHHMGVTALAAAPGDGARLLSASIDKTMRLWDVDRMEQVREIKVHDGQVYSAVFTPGGHNALTAGRDGYVVDWDLETGKPVREIKAHDRIVWDVGVTPNGQFAVSVSSEDAARVWHLGTGDRIGDIADDTDRAKPWLTSDHPGAKLFTKCARCHAITAEETQRSGPHFAGLFGRKVGGLQGYNYSQALEQADFEWNEKTIFELFHRGPDEMLPGTKMPVQRVPDERQLTELVDYLKVLTKNENGAAN